jgi:hypothetical protein
MKRRVSFITGAADLFNLILYLNKNAPVFENHLVIYSTGNIPKKLLLTIKIIANSSRQFTSINYFEINHRELANSFLDKLSNLVKRKISELTIWRVYGKLEHGIIQSLKPSKLVLIENGIATYCPPNIDQSSSLKAFIKPDIAWLSLIDRFGIPYYLNDVKIIVPLPEEFRKTCENLLDLFPEITSFKNRILCDNLVIVVGTSLYRTGAICQEDEINSQIDIIKAYYNSRYRVVYKAHPRLPSKYFEQFLYRFDCIHWDYPLELFFASIYPHNFSVVSIASTAIATAEIYFQAKVKLIPAHFISTLEKKLPHVALIRNRYQNL